MIPYVLIFLLVLVALVSEKWIKRDWPYYVVLSLLVLFAGFRDMIGGFDIYIYANVYEWNILFIAVFSYFEIGFRAFMIALHVFSAKREFFVFATALLMLFMHFRILKRNSNLPYFAIFIYFCKFYLFSFVYLRQGLAMGIIWFSIPFILNKKYIKAIILIAVAYTFHKSSLIFVPLLFIAGRRFSTLQLLSGIFAFLIVFLSPVGSFFGQFLAEASANAKLAGYASAGSSINIFYVIELMLFTTLAVIFRKHFYRYKETMLIFNGFMMYLLMSVVGLTNPTFVRLAWYYFIFVALALPYMYSFIADGNVRVMFKGAISFYYAMVFFRLLIVYDDGDMMPYKTIFQHWERDGMWKNMEYRGKDGRLTGDE